jgi:hypothetical protein
MKNTFKNNFPKINYIYLSWFIALIILTVIFLFGVSTQTKTLVDLETKTIPFLENALKDNSNPEQVAQYAKQTYDLLNNLAMMIALFILAIILLGTLKNKILFEKLNKKVSYEQFVLAIELNIFTLTFILFFTYKLLATFTSLKVFMTIFFTSVILIFVIQNLTTMFVFENNLKHFWKKTFKTFLAYVLSLIPLILGIFIIYILAMFITQLNVLAGLIFFIIFSLIYYLTIKEIYFLYLSKIFK